MNDQREKAHQIFSFLCVEIDLIIAMLEAELYNGLKKKTVTK